MSYGPDTDENVTDDHVIIIPPIVEAEPIDWWARDDADISVETPPEAPVSDA